MRKRILGLAILMGAAALSAQETYSTWSGHRNVFFNTGASGAGVSANVTGFPVLIRLKAADSAIFSQALSGGADIRFTKADDVTRLKHQIDSWDATTKTAAIWVLVDTVKGNSRTQKIRMHWGKTGAADSSSGTVFSASGFTNVWHLGNAAGVTARPNAITGGNPATPTNFPGGYSAPVALIGKGEYLRGGRGYSSGNANASNLNDYLNLGSITTDYSKGFTFSLWINQEVLGNNTIYYSGSETPDGLNTGGLIIIGGQGNEGALGAKVRQRNGTSGANSGILNSDGSLGAILGTWSQIVGTLDSTGEMAYYLNAVAIGVASGIEPYASTTRPVNNLGTSLAHMQYTDSSFHGTLDEARLANVGRSADWVKLEYENQKAAQSLVFFDSVTVGVNSRVAANTGFSAKVSGRGVMFQVRGVNTTDAKVSVTDMHGRTVWSKAFPAGANQLAWDGGRVSSGIYLATLTQVDGQGRTTQVLQAKVPLTR